MEGPDRNKLSLYVPKGQFIEVSDNDELSSILPIGLGDVDFFGGD